MGNPTKPKAAKFTYNIAFEIENYIDEIMKKPITNNNRSTKLWLWPLIVFLLALSLSFVFGMMSELVLTKTTIIISIFVIVVLVALSILFDVLGLAVASCDETPFTSMASKKIKGSKQALILIKNADRVSSICNDVLGDVCGILSGAAGAAISLKLSISTGNFTSILIASIVSSIIAGVTIGGKSIFKKVAIDHCTGITLVLARFVNFFTHRG